MNWSQKIAWYFEGAHWMFIKRVFFFSNNNITIFTVIYFSECFSFDDCLNTLYNIWSEIEFYLINFNVLQLFFFLYEALYNFVVKWFTFWYKHCQKKKSMVLWANWYRRKSNLYNLNSLKPTE